MERGSGFEARRDVEERTTMVRNRDIPVLSDVFAVMQSVKQAEEMRLWQYERMQRLTQHLTGMPRGGGLPQGFDEAFARLSEIEDDYARRVELYLKQLRAAERIINGIESPSMRAFVVMKYAMNLPDATIRRELNLTRRGLERARASVEGAERMSAAKWPERYLAK